MEHNHMAIIGIRMLLQLLGMLYGVGGALALYAFDFDRQAFNAFVIGNGFAWLMSPAPEARELYLKFQTSRMPRQT